MVRIGLVGCVKEKRKTRSQAKVLYVSSLFRKARSYAERNYDDWLILSAKYGLVDPEEEIRPYNETLNNKSVRERKEWANKVFQRLKLLYPDTRSQVFMFHAGKKYREFLETLLKAKEYRFEVPLKGLSLGRQLQWYSRHENQNTAVSL